MFAYPERLATALPLPVIGKRAKENHGPQVRRRAGRGSGTRARVSILAAVLMAETIVGVGIGSGVSTWMGAKIDMQRAADTAARAGMIAFANTLDPRLAATAAGQVAQLNGVAADTRLSWDADTQTLTGGPLTVRVRSGRATTPGAAIEVTVAQTTPAVLMRVLGL